MSHPSPAKTTRAANVFTVSQLNQRAKQLLEVSFATVKVEGELSSLSRPSSGHWYFSLKDSGAQVRCAMFRSRVAQLRFQPKEGDLIEIRARVSLYEARGDYQLIVDGMKPAGEGALLLAFQDLKKRLAQQGLFEPERKRPLPLPKRIGVITSPSGAALHDILTVLERRAPDIEVDIYPTQVQGAQAAGQIIEAIQRANRDNRVDVLIVGRGGGSMEDLWCFNDERLAHTIAQSSLPIISAVGHETDTTIADFVADQRAATPSAAAELVSPDHQQRVQQLQTLDHRLRQQMQARLQEARQQVSNVRHRLQSPEHTIQRHAQRLDQLESRLRRAWQQQQQQRQARLNQQQQALLGQHPERIIQLGQTRQQQLQQRLHRAMEQCLQQQRLQLANQVKLLDSLSPLSVLSRGYAICTALDGTVIQHPQQVRCGDQIQARLAQGTITCQVTDPDTLHSDHSGNRSR